FWLKSSRGALASAFMPGNCAEAATPRWNRLSARRTVAVLTSRLALATSFSRSVRVGSLNSDHQEGSGEAVSLPPASGAAKAPEGRPASGGAKSGPTVQPDKIATPARTTRAGARRIKNNPAVNARLLVRPPIS